MKWPHESQLGLIQQQGMDGMWAWRGCDYDFRAFLPSNSWFYLYSMSPWGALSDPSCSVFHRPIPNSLSTAYLIWREFPPLPATDSPSFAGVYCCCLLAVFLPQAFGSKFIHMQSASFPIWDQFPSYRGGKGGLGSHLFLGGKMTCHLLSR